MLPFFAVLTPVIILFCGLAVDLSVLQLRKIQLQSAADAAVIGAELEYERNTGVPAATNQAKTDAKSNGFTNGSNGVTVGLTFGPAYGTYSSFYDTLQVTISQTVKTPFMALANGGSVILNAKASAMMPPCFWASGGSEFLLPSIQLASVGISAPCPSYASPNMTVDYFSSFNFQGENITGSAAVQGSSGHFNYLPRLNANVTSDPLAYITQPVFSGMCDYMYPASAVILPTATTLSPGKYCGGMNFTNANVSLLPGTYIITGSSTWLNSNVTLATAGAGVTLFFTTGGGYGYGGLTINGGNITISAPVDTTYATCCPTILFFGDRNRPALIARDYNIAPASFVGDGIWYTTHTGILVGGPISAPHYLVFDTDNFYDYHNAFSMSENFSNIPTGNPFRPLGGLVQ